MTFVTTTVVRIIVFVLEVGIPIMFAITRTGVTPVMNTVRMRRRLKGIVPWIDTPLLVLQTGLAPTLVLLVKCNDVRPGTYPPNNR